MDVTDGMQSSHQVSISWWAHTEIVHIVHKECLSSLTKEGFGDDIVLIRHDRTTHRTAKWSHTLHKMQFCMDVTDVRGWWRVKLLTVLLIRIRVYLIRIIVIFAASSWKIIVTLEVAVSTRLYFPSEIFVLIETALFDLIVTNWKLRCRDLFFSASSYESWWSANILLVIAVSVGFKCFESTLHTTLVPKAVILALNLLTSLSNNYKRCHHFKQPNYHLSDT